VGTPFPIKMRIGGAERDPERYPLDDDALGRALLGRVEVVLAKGIPRPTVLAFTADQVWWYDLGPAVKMKADIHRLIAAIAGQDEIDCVAVVGVLKVRVSRGKHFPGAVAFLEWPDGRWWSSMQPLRSVGQRKLEPVPQAEVIERNAVDGWPRPGGLGGWWSRARREGLKLRVQRTGDQQVH
jgi:hypothetical protein